MRTDRSSKFHYFGVDPEGTSVWPEGLSEGTGARPEDYLCLISSVRTCEQDYLLHMIEESLELSYISDDFSKD